MRNDNKYTAISRDEFISLYRFGEIYTNSRYILDSLDGIIELLEFLPIEYEEDYLVLELNDKANKIDFANSKELYRIRLTNVKTIKALSESAQSFYKTKFNPKIKFQVFDSSAQLQEVFELKEFENIDRGIHILLEQFGMKEYGKKLDEELGEGIKKAYLKIDDYKKTLEEDFKNFYLDLLLYKRENKITKKPVGHIYDLVIIKVLEERKKQYIKYFIDGEFPIKESATYKALEEAKNNSLLEITKNLKTINDEKVQRFIGEIGIDMLVSGAIFLNLQYLLSEEGRERNSDYYIELKAIVENFVQDYPSQLARALYLIGLKFGYRKLYDDYYDNCDLDIFKDSTINTTAKKNDETKKTKESKNINNLEIKKSEESESGLDGKDVEKLGSEDSSEKMLGNKEVVDDPVAENNAEEEPTTKAYNSHDGNMDGGDKSDIAENDSNNPSKEMQKQEDKTDYLKATDITDGDISGNSYQSREVVMASEYSEAKKGEKAKAEDTIVEDFLESLEMDSLADVWYRKNNKSEKLKIIKQNYDKKEIIQEILKPNSFIRLEDFLESLEMDSLADVWYRKNNKNEKLKTIKQNYDKKQIIQKIQQSSLQYDGS